MTRRASPAAARFPWQGLDEDRRNALLLYALIGAVVVFAVALIGYGYYRDRIAPNHETVLTVGNRKFDLAFLQRRAEAEIKLNRVAPSSTLQNLVVNTLQTIELEELTRQAAKAQGVVVTGEDIDSYIRSRLGLALEAPRDRFAAAYRADVLQSGLPVRDYREMLAAEVIQDRLLEKLASTVPAAELQVDAQIIRTSAESRAQEAKQKIDSGQGFNVTAATYSIAASKDSGGELGWITRSEVPAKVGDALFTSPIGQVSDPIQDSDGWYLVLARGREEQEIDKNHKARIASVLYGTLLNDTRTALGSSNRLTEDQIVRIGRKLLGG